VEALEEEDSEADLVVVLVVLAVISQTKICMLITVGLIHQVVPADLVEADWRWMDTAVVAGMEDKDKDKDRGRGRDRAGIPAADTSQNPVSRSWFAMCVVFPFFLDRRIGVS
jgi:hypothetical protein